MTLLGRSKELGLLRGALDARESTIVAVSGVRGGGKSSVVRHAVRDYPNVVHVCPPLPDPDQRAALAHRLGLPSEGEASWERLCTTLVEMAAAHDRPFVLVLDDAQRLVEARSRLLRPLLATLPGAAADGVAIHVVFVGPEGSLPEVAEGEGIEQRRISVGPLPFRAVAQHMPGREPHAKIRAYGVFGGIPRVFEQLDPDVTVGTNVRRLLLSPGGALRDAGGTWLEHDLQTPVRYYAILRALALGETDWRGVHEGVSDLTRSGQVAPYLRRLIELGLVEARRSLDANPEGRARRYAIADPFHAFWFRFVLPHILDPSVSGPDAEGRDYYARTVRPGIESHMRTAFPLVCRQHMAHDAIETLGAAAREEGSLWGPGYDLPVAGILSNGAAYFGACRWSDADPGNDPSPLQTIEGSMRETRYGFGRERRLRIVFTGRPPGVTLLREVARRQDAELIDAEALLG